MARELTDRSAILFGRGPDLAYLLSRAGRKGITAVVGRAQMGKSWLLTELARQLSQDGGALRSGTIQSLNLKDRPSYLVGFTDETADLLLRAVVDLYVRWLENSSYREQALVVWQQQKKDLVSKAGEAFGGILEKLSIPGAGSVGKLVKGTFDALATANRELLSGGVQISRLQIEQGRDLLALVAQVTARPMVLVFDQWERSPAIELEANILDSFLRHLDEWPPCHIFLGVNPYEKPPAATVVEKLRDDFPGPVEVYELAPMHLDDSDSRAALLGYVRGKVAATKTVTDEELLEMISGNPRVVNRWTSDYEAERMYSLRELRDVADDANEYRYREFTILLRELSDEQRRFGMRLALLPEASSPETWRALQPLMLEGVQAKDLDSLKRSKILESSTPPSYGHTKRSEAALQWLTKENTGELREVCESLIFSLGRRVTDTASQQLPLIGALAELQPIALKLTLSNLPQALCKIALDLHVPELAVPFLKPLVKPRELDNWFEGLVADRQKLLSAAEEVKEDKTRAPVVPLMIMGLLNALLSESRMLEIWKSVIWESDAKIMEEIVQRHQVVLNELRVVDRREMLLHELWLLANAYRDDADVRQWVTAGLATLLGDAIIAQQFASWSKQLWQLAKAYSQDERVRRLLAGFLFRTLDDAWLGYYANQEQSALGEVIKRSNELLEELQELRRDYPEDAWVREKLAWGLVNTLTYAKQETPGSSDALLDEVRKLADDNPQDAEVRKQLAMALFNTLIHTEQAQVLKRSVVLLEELQELRRDYPEDATVREWLAKGLSNTLVYARQQGEPERSDALLQELRQLSRDNSADATVRDRLANSLFNTIVLDMQEKASDRISAPLKTLSHLASEYRDDTSVRKYLASGLYNAMIYAEQEGALQQHDAWLEELRQLVRSYPEDETMIKAAPLLDLEGRK